MVSNFIPFTVRYLKKAVDSSYSFSQFLKIDTFCNFEKCCCMLVGLSVLFASGQVAAHCCNHPFWQCCQLAMKEEPVNLHLLKHILSGNIWEMALYTTYATYLWHCWTKETLKEKCSPPPGTQVQSEERQIGLRTSIWTLNTSSFLNRNGWNLVSRHIFSRCFAIQNFSSLSLVLTDLYDLKWKSLKKLH